MTEILTSVTRAAYVHVFHHQLYADRPNAGRTGFNTSPAFAASYVARSFLFFFLPCCEAPSGHRRCVLPLGAQALTMPSLMTWYPCRSGPALHCKVPFSPLCFFLSESRGHRLVIVFYLDCVCFRLELLSCLVIQKNTSRLSLSLLCVENLVPRTELPHASRDVIDFRWTTVRVVHLGFSTPVSPCLALSSHTLRLSAPLSAHT